MEGNKYENPHFVNTLKQNLVNSVYLFKVDSIETIKKMLFFLF